MVQSMTAFARRQQHGEWGTLTWEIRSVNHRYLEWNPRLVDGFREIESIVRERARLRLERGKVDCYLRFQPSSALPQEVTVNLALTRALIQAGQEVDQITHNGSTLATIDILRWPGIIEIAQGDLSAAHQQALDLFDLALEDLVAARTREGNALKQLIDDRLQLMSPHIAAAQTAYPEALKQWRDRLLAKLIEVQQSLDPSRLELEMVMFAQKSDVSEELDRLQTHIAAVRKTLQQGKAVGRRLDFLMQELNREANTLGAKAINADLTNAAVELKVLIEQMREQIQNIE